MQMIVIKIPDNYDLSKIQNGSIASKIILNAVKNGTPLPKGHGELVDIRPLMRGLYEEICVGELTYTTSEVYKMLENEAPTIIEADK